MNKQETVSPEAADPGKGSIETAATQSSARQHAQRVPGGKMDGKVQQGTPPTNRVPNNCNSEYFKALRWGVDSLYLSYPGELLPEVDDRLKDLKKIAQSLEDHEKVLAQYPIEGHVFEVKDKGSKFFPYTLVDNAFHIQFSRSKAMPLAYVQISSEYLTHVGPVEAEKVLRQIVEQFGTINGSANVSRIDLFVDFRSSESMEGWDRHAWVTRASNIVQYAVDGAFSGWGIGVGGVISCRLYDKTLEIETKSKKFYLHKLWKLAAWNGIDKVWRLEFEIKREVLTQKGLPSLNQVLANLNGLWSYATTEWLRLTLPNPDDQTRARWPLHTLWGYLSSVDWETNGGALSSRFTSARLPGDDRLFSVVLGPLISFMAREDIQDWHVGHKLFIAALESYHTGKSQFLGLSFNDYIAEKISIKRREFNKILHEINVKYDENEAELARQAAQYRKQSDGE